MDRWGDAGGLQCLCTSLTQAVGIASGAPNPPSISRGARPSNPPTLRLRLLRLSSAAAEEGFGRGETGISAQGHRRPLDRLRYNALRAGAGFCQSNGDLQQRCSRSPAQRPLHRCTSAMQKPVVAHGQRPRKAKCAACGEVLFCD